MPAPIKPNPNPPIPPQKWNTPNQYGFQSFKFIQVDPGNWQYTLQITEYTKPITSIFGVK